MSALAPVTDIPEDIQQTARGCIVAKELEPGDLTVARIARAILAERERCAQQLEAMIARRRKEFPRRYLANAYIQACVNAIRRGPSALSKANPLSARGFSNAEQAGGTFVPPEVSPAANSPSVAALPTQAAEPDVNPLASGTNSKAVRP